MLWKAFEISCSVWFDDNTTQMAAFPIGILGCIENPGTTVNLSLSSDLFKHIDLFGSSKNLPEYTERNDVLYQYILQTYNSSELKNRDLYESQSNSIPIWNFQCSQISARDYSQLHHTRRKLYIYWRKSTFDIPIVLTLSTFNSANFSLEEINCNAEHRTDVRKCSTRSGLTETWC